MTPPRPLTRRRTRGLAALVVAGAAMAAVGSQAVATGSEDTNRGVDVYKTAESHHAAYWKWDVEKSPDRRVGYNHENHHVKVGYKVTATPKVVETGHYKVYGKIGVHNKKNKPIVVHSIHDGIGDVKCDVSTEWKYAGDGGDLPRGKPVDNGHYLYPGAHGYVYYTCNFPTEPEAKKGRNKAVVTWSVVREPQEQISLVNGHHTSEPEAGYDFRKGEIEHRGYTEADVYDRMFPKTKREVLGKDLHVLDGPQSYRYYKYLRAPRKVNDCDIHKNRAILIAHTAENGESNGTETSDWTDLKHRVEADAYVKICTKERKPSSEDPAPPDVTVENGSSEDPAPGTPKPEPKPADVKPSDFDPRDDDKPSGDDKPNNGKNALHVTKRANKRKAYVGSRVVWKIRVTNKGDKVLRNVRVRDNLPKYFRAKKVLGRNKGVTLRKRSVLVKIAKLRPGQTRHFRIVTDVKARPFMDKRVKFAASKKRGKAKRAYVARMRNGIACNVVIARAKHARNDRGRACIKVMKPGNGGGNNNGSDNGNGENAPA